MGVPGNANPLLLRTVTAAATGISRSLRFNSADSAYLSRTPASATNRRTWTFSCWVKRSALNADTHIFSGAQDVNNQTVVRFSSNNSLAFYIYSGGSFVGNYVTSPVYRDTSAWMHVIAVADTPNAVATDRMIIYVNGVRVTVFSTSTAPSQNADSWVNTANQHNIGRWGVSNTEYFNGYLADIYFIDGQALDPTSFGETDATTGVWNPKAYTGSYGTNGFHLEFADNSAATATTLGKDTSGNGNNFSPSNLSVTAGAGNDSLVDVPSSTGTDNGLGGEVRGNYCTWNPLSVTAGTFSQGNLEYVASSSWRRALGTFAVSTGKWYYEATLVSAPNSSRSSGSDYNCVGWSSVIFNDTNDPGANTTALLLGDNGYYKNFTGSKTDAGALSNGDVVGIAVDLDANTFAFYKSGSSIASGTIGGTAGRELSPAILSYSNAYGVWNVNFGQRAFSAGPSGKAPSGYKAICTTNLPAPSVTKPSTAMDVKLYSGSSATQSITGLGFSPDLVWLKQRSAGNPHYLYDIVRGINLSLSSSQTIAEQNLSNEFTAFNSDGFTLGSDPNDIINKSGQTYVAWAFDAGTTTSSNNQGSITSSVRANATAGFSVIGWTGGSSGTASIGHGLGVAPSFIIMRPRNSTSNWVCYHKSLGNDAFLRLNTTDASGSSSACFGTGPTSTVFTINQGNLFGISGDYIGYAFSPVVGYSSFGSYTGNGSADGPFVYTGFRPRYLLFKSAGVGDWVIIDTARDTYNVSGYNLYPNDSVGESFNARLDILSNGFKLRSTFSSTNPSSTTVVYAAFAESPFNYARAR